ncbi:TetR/AcrR family transcriptional regulator [Luteolibacter pohnpeiensis]|uniref:TetR/AcrR family transcriptional regulator n=1 Tax=Luteolibacter pohnpeiensis TaxID=454153 RepID=A0A934S1U7_9BACT|nr:TetR/AcrR family transcriptional regulator [Luteolibacter pohnpeiensis]MBK1880841.1 TetR/AcrR family transcriptional regulator [Luteolibacter pohnpeiensis]
MTNLSSTADSILSSARELIVAGGYNGFSYADISAQVGIRKASIHHHFPSKAGLVVALVSRYRKEAEAGLAQLEQHVKNPIDQLKAYTGYWEKCIADATAPFCICALLASQIPVLPEEVVIEVRSHFQMLSKWLTRVIERGEELGDLKLSSSAQTEAEKFMATLHGAMLSARAYGDASIFSTIVHALIDRLTLHS